MTDRILIIESEPNLRREFASALTEVGFIVDSVPDYSEALLKLDEFNPDLAIVDEVLPSGDGKEACFELRNAFSIPVILLGKDSSGEAWKAAVEAGADFYFTKSFNRRVLAARVKAILRRYRGEMVRTKKAASDSQAASPMPSPAPSLKEAGEGGGTS